MERKKHKKQRQYVPTEKLLKLFKHSHWLQLKVASFLWCHRYTVGLIKKWTTPETKAKDIFFALTQLFNGTIIKEDFLLYFTPCEE